MAAEYFSPPAPALDSNGNTNEGAKWYFYATGTLTPQAVYADVNLGTSLGAEVTADAAGRFADIYFDESLTYRAILKSAGGATTYFDIDPVNRGAGIGFSHATTYGAGTLGKKLQQFINPMDAPYNATGDGTANDYTAFAAADAAAAALGVPLYITKTHRLNTSYASTAPIVWAGGKVKPASGTTFTVGTGLDAPAVQVFDTSLGGTIAVTGTYQPWGWAEWWGLVPSASGSAAANLAAINAAIVALRETCLLPRTYYTSAQITINVSDHRLRGSGHQYDGTNEGRVTRILCTSASAHIVYMGDSSFSTIGAMSLGMKLSDIYLDRSTAPDVTTGCAGVFVKWTKYAKLENVKTNNSVYGFEFSGTIHAKAIDCHALRDTAGTGGTDTWKAFYIEGATDIGLNGSNASLYLIRCLAERGIVIADSVGFYADHKMTDLFLVSPETSQCATGIEIAGDADNTTLNYDNIDIQIVDPVVDSFTFAGIYIHGLNKFGSVEVKGGYYGPAATSTAAVNVVDNLGAVHLDGGQFLMGVASSAFGVRVKDSNNVNIDGCMINEADPYAVVLDGAANCRVTPVIKNHSAVCDAGVALLNTCDANWIAPMISGAANKVAIGIQAVGTGDTNSVYDVGGISSVCITGGAANKLVRNSVQIVATGASGTNEVRGPMS